MTKFTSTFAGSMAAAIALATAFTGANATPTPLYGGGSTLAEKVYRDLFDNYGSTSAGDLCAGLTTTCPTSHYNSTTEFLYVGVGSGNGVKAFDAHDASQYVSGAKTPDHTPTPSGSDFGAFYGTGTGAGWTPGTGVGPFYPKVTFSGSDNVLVASDVTAVTALGFGAPIQIPGLVAAIAVPFHPTAGWTPKGVKPTGGSSTVDLSTNTLCGIFTGAITDWSDAEIKANNKNVTLGSGQITVVYRNDSSGTTFLFSNAILNQCGTTSHPVSTHPVPDAWLTVAGNTSIVYNATAPHYQSGTSFYINVFKAGILPSNFLNNSALTGVTGGANGSGGVKAAINATVGSIGYVSPDFVQPVDTAGPLAANLQTYLSYSTSATPVYKAPTAASASPIMINSAPPSFSGSPAPAANPLNWGALAPTPSNSFAYPIGGFTFIDLYSCYADKNVVTALTNPTAGALGYFVWVYGGASVNGGVPASVLAANGFAAVPTPWATAINTLLKSPTLGIGVPKVGKKAGTKACKTITNGA